VEEAKFDKISQQKFLVLPKDKNKRARPKSIIAKRGSEKFNMRSDIEGVINKGESSALVNRF